MSIRRLFSLSLVLPSIASLVSLGSPITAADSSVVLTHGPVVGAVTASQATVLVRTSGAASVQIRYGRSADLSDAVDTATTSTDPSTDLATKIVLTSLSPATPYFLDVLVDGTSQLSAPYPQFKTFPAPGEEVPFRFVVLSDFHTVTDRPLVVETFASAADENPDFVIIGGDFDHRKPTTIDEKRQMFKDLYTPARGLEDFVGRILRGFPVAHMWDDHDYGANNSDKTYPYKTLSRQVLQEYFPVYPLGAFGDWQSFSYGQADFFLLDSRSQRDPNDTPDGPGKSMLDGDDLGAAGQLRWLEDSLLASTARWKFIVTPVPFNPTVPKTDSWNGFLYERHSLVQFIRRNDVKGVILLSGDLHAGGIDDGSHSSFPEMLVPSVNMPDSLTAIGTGTWSEGFYGGPSMKSPPADGYGLVTVETNPERVRLEVKDKEGRGRIRLAVAP